MSSFLSLLLSPSPSLIYFCLEQSGNCILLLTFMFILCMKKHKSITFFRAKLSQQHSMQPRSRTCIKEIDLRQTGAVILSFLALLPGGGGGGVLTPNFGRYVPRQSEKMGKGSGTGSGSSVKMWGSGTSLSRFELENAGLRNELDPF